MLGFNKKNRQKKKKADEVSVHLKTMNDDLKNSEGKEITLKYQENPTNHQSLPENKQAQQKAANLTNVNNKNEPVQPSVKGTFNQQKEIKQSENNSPFSNTPSDTQLDAGLNKMEENVPFVEKIDSEETSSTAKVDQTEVSNKNAPQQQPKPTGSFPQQESEKLNTLFNERLNKQLSKKRRNKTLSFLIAIIFVFGLAAAVWGAYYWYMHKEAIPEEELAINQKNNSEGSNNDVAKSDAANGGNGISGENQPSQNKNISDKESVGENAPIGAGTENQKNGNSVEDLITTPENLISDLKNFAKQINLENNFVFITPWKVTSDGIKEEMTTAELLTALQFPAATINPSDFKSVFKIFIHKNKEGRIRFGFVLEPRDEIDLQDLRSKIMALETSLPKIFLPLFYPEDQPLMFVGSAVFNTNPDNYNSRYFNYRPGDSTASVDWNILELNQGRILYFANSRQTAEEITNYFKNNF